MGRVFGMIWVVLVAFSCGSIPTDSKDGNLDSNGVYVSDLWRFQITIPDSTWGFQSQTYQQRLAANGVPQMELWMISPVLSGTATFRPVLYLKPDALKSGNTLSLVIADVETELQGAFNGYVAQGKTTVRVDSENATEWLFQATSAVGNFMPGTRFWVTVVLHNQAVYLLLGNGTSDRFPVDLYRKVASSLKFQ